MVETAALLLKRSSDDYTFVLQKDHPGEDAAASQPARADDETGYTAALRELRDLDLCGTPREDSGDAYPSPDAQSGRHVPLGDGRDASAQLRVPLQTPISATPADRTPRYPFAPCCNSGSTPYPIGDRASIALPIPAPSQNQAKRGGLPVLEFGTTKWIHHNISGLTLDISDQYPKRVNVLLATIDFKYVFGGYIGMFNLALRLKREGYRIRIILHERTEWDMEDWRCRDSEVSRRHHLVRRSRNDFPV